MSSLLHLSDSLLIEAYHRSVNLHLNKDFVKLLWEEIKRRGLERE